MTVGSHDPGVTYLGDKSAHQQRYRSPEAAAVLDKSMANGALAVCEVVALELLYSARNGRDYKEIRGALDALTWLPTSNAALRRAIDVQDVLAQRGQHRRPLPDLVIAATAEEHGAVVLHYGNDFELIANVTGQPVQWIVPRGTVE